MGLRIKITGLEEPFFTGTLTRCATLNANALHPLLSGDHIDTLLSLFPWNSGIYCDFLSLENKIVMEPEEHAVAELSGTPMLFGAKHELEEGDVKFLKLRDKDFRMVVYRSNF